MILAHNHPSDVAEPSTADCALSLVEVRVLDYSVVGEGKPVSFAERGLI